MSRYLAIGFAVAFACAGWGSAPTHAASKDQSLSGPMAPIPGGAFKMGDGSSEGREKERPVHDVTVKPFLMGRYEVTVGQFRRFVEETGFRTEAERDPASSGCVTMNVEKDGWERAGHIWREPGYAQTDRYPVSCVSWNDAQAYIAWLNGKTHGHYRLPSEAEWEYAARAGSTTRFFWGDDVSVACTYANGADRTPWPNGKHWQTQADCSDGYFYAAPTGSYKPNAFGLYDTAGNVWEWVQDCWHPTYEGAPVDGSAWASPGCDAHLARGGSWHSSPGLKSGGREWSNPQRNEFGNLGFRLAADR